MKTKYNVTEPRYDASGVNGFSFMRDMQRAAPESRFPVVDLAGLSASDRDTLCSYLRADDGSLSEEDQEFCGEIADEIDALEPDSETHTIELDSRRSNIVSPTRLAKRGSLED